MLQKLVLYCIILGFMEFWSSGRTVERMILMQIGKDGETEATQPDGRTPLYKRIKAEIIHQIETSVLVRGTPLPTRSELAAHYRTTKATIDRAMQELTRD